MSVPNPSSQRHGEAEEMLQSKSSEVVVGCRKSELALVQSLSVISKLQQAVGSLPTFRIATGSAAGDTDKQTPFMILSKQTGGSDIGKSLWTNDLESDLVAGKTQLLVHSLKDMPTTLPPKCLLGAVPEREDASDAVIMRADSKFKSIDELPPVGQGALGVEVSTDRQNIQQLVRHVDHLPSRWRGMAERAMLRSLQGGCSSPIGVCSTFEALMETETADTTEEFQQQLPSLDRGKLHLQATILDMTGTTEIFAEDVAVVQCDIEAEQLGVSVASLLLHKGARRLLPVTI
ncbi:Porphobilinogen deaminase [Colletotrichum truncatum]|uniref:Porphobilinogen deaminase n=1 Tax=Colletotrichum truncatum TaxID=5467 RepID=A0ACC3ZCT9_COLTU